MRLAEFHNALRILTSIDAEELHSAIRLMSPRQKADFDRDPVRFFIRADDVTADALWAIIERRQTRARAA